MERPGRAAIWRPALYVLGGLVLLAAGVLLLELAFPDSADADEGLPPIRPRLERAGERLIRIDAGLLDRSELRFGDEETVEHVDHVYRCLEERIEEAFGPESAPQGRTRWSRRLEVGKRLRDVRAHCAP